MSKTDWLSIFVIVAFGVMTWWQGYCAGKKNGWVEGFMSRLVRRVEPDED